jgi:hypothetical protein
MKVGQIVVLLILSTLAGCGVETMGAAATSAAARKQELEQAQKTEQQAQPKIDQALQAQQERLQATE